MKPLPDLDNQSAMIRRGREATLIQAKREAAEALRDCCTHIQTVKEWPLLLELAREAAALSDRIASLALLHATLTEAVAA